MTSALFETSDLPALQQARDCWSNGQRESAFSLFEQATQQHRRNLKAWLEYAKALREDYQFVAAENVLKKLPSIGQWSIEQAAQVSRLYLYLYDPPSAIEILESLGQRANAPLLGQLAVSYEQSGRFPAALATIERARSLDQHSLELAHVQARLLRIDGQTDEAMSVLRHVVKQSTEKATRDRQKLNAQLMIRSLCELALLYDQQSEFEKAFQTIETAKKIQRQHPQAEAISRKGVDRVMKQWAAHRQWAGGIASRDLSVENTWEASDEFPAIAHLIGFPRSGTTLLETRLGSATNAYCFSERTAFVDQVLPAWNPLEWSDMTRQQQLSLRNKYTQGLLQTSRQWRRDSHSLVNQKLIDKKPGNLFFLGQILTLFPQAPLLMTLRDPRDIFISSYSRYFPLTDLSANFLSPKTFLSVYRPAFEIWKLCRSVIAAEQYVEVRYEDFCESPELQIDRISQVLKLDRNPSTAANDAGEPAASGAMIDREIHSPSYVEVTRPVSRDRVGRWKNYESFFAPLFKEMAPLLEELHYA